MRRFFTDRTAPTEAELSQVYDRVAPVWRRGPGKLETWLAGDEVRTELVSQLTGDVLEIGVGAGDTLLRLSQQPRNLVSYTGIDLSEGMLAEAGTVPADFPVRLLIANAEDLSQFPDDSFDTVTGSMVFCTIADVPRALAEVGRVLKPDGKLVLLEHVLSSNRVIAKLQRWLAPMQIRKIGCHLDRTTRRTVVECGYTIVEERQRRFGVIQYMVAVPPD